MKITLKDGTELEKGKFYLWSGSNEGYRYDNDWTDTLCKIRDISEDRIRIFEVFANEEYTWEITSINEKCSFKKLWFGRMKDWFKKLIN
jgi:hypothetical protein